MTGFVSLAVSRISFLCGYWLPKLSCLRRSAPAADEVDDFQPVTIVECGLRPAIPRHDVAIQFHCDTIGLHAQRLNQRGQRERRNVEFALVPIDLKFHDAEAGTTASVYSALCSANFRVAVRPS
jgi:hypothetical protein